MDITSENKRRKKHYGNSLLRYGFTYVIITTVVLLFLNLYCSETTQEIFYKSKEATMLEKSRTASVEFSELDVLNHENILQVLSKNEALMTSRIMVTDASACVIFDTNAESAEVGQISSLPQILTAMDGNDVFSWKYHDGLMQSISASPVYAYGNLTGCVYMMELDESQGALMHSLQRNIFAITAVLELIIILFSALSALVFSSKLRRILASMRIIQNGDYSHKMKLSGRDELNLLADEFNSLTDKLYISENKRRQFVSDASHELKTPLASIKLLSDSILQNKMNEETVREFVSDIGQEAERLNRMSQKLLSLSRIESQEDGDCEIVNIQPTIDRVLKMLSGLSKENKILIEQHIAEDPSILILEDDLYEICFNLIENGIKYNRIDGTLTVSLSQENDNAILKVTDTGMGIPNDAIPHLFERFYRVDKARSRKSGGSGLGLAIVRNLVERNGGQIFVESQVDVGSTFTVSFPVFDVPLPLEEDFPNPI